LTAAPVMIGDDLLRVLTTRGKVSWLLEQSKWRYFAFRHKKQARQLSFVCDRCHRAHQFGAWAALIIPTLVDRRVTCGYRVLSSRTRYDAAGWRSAITSFPDIAVIGAGFYGLSVPARAGVSLRITAERLNGKGTL
jgi:hypothetical protein